MRHSRTICSVFSDPHKGQAAPIFRLIARLDVKSNYVVKGIHLEGLRRVGEPLHLMSRYSDQGIDEFVLQDVTASLYGRNNLSGLVARSNDSIFLPVTVGGGIRTRDDAARVTRSGADKVSINTGALVDPALITEVSSLLGSQAICIAIDARRDGSGWTCMAESGRVDSQRDLLEWVTEAEALGAGEVLLTSIEREGTLKGIDVEMIEAVTASSRLPVIACGGTRTPDDAIRACLAGASGLAMSAVLHYGKFQVDDFKRALVTAGIEVRS